MTQMFSIENVSVAYGKVERRCAMSRCRSKQGQIVTVIGPNGAGKTTLLMAAIGLLKSTGRMMFQGADLARIDVEGRVERGLCLVPEKRELFADMSVADNLLLGTYSLRDRSTTRKSLDDVFDRFPRLKERSKQAAGTLSGGERQMLALGRALMAKPKLLVLDEPSLGLAPLIVREIFRTIASLRSLGVSVLARRAERPRCARDRGLRLCAGNRRDHPVRSGGHADPRPEADRTPILAATEARCGRLQATGSRASPMARSADGKGRQALLAIGGLVDAFVVHESLPGLHADASLAHIRRDDVRRGVTAVAERLDQIAAGVMQDIAAAPVDELEQAEHREAESEAIDDGLVDILRRGDALLHHAGGFVHRQRLDSGTMKPGRAAQTTGTLPMPSSSAFIRTVTSGAVSSPGDNSIQRHQIGWIEPVRIEKAAGVFDRVRRDRRPVSSTWSKR